MLAITGEPLDVAALAAAVRRDGDGAVVTFLGVVRERSDDGRPVDGLEYEAYPAMAVPEMEKIVAEAAARFSGVKLAMAHRTGTLRIGEASVAIAASAPHRAAAFDACEYAIDELKKRVPVWKKEHYTDGDAAWRETPQPR
jgi:molybdopterin synthase catalytic subunit